MDYRVLFQSLAQRHGDCCLSTWVWLARAPLNPTDPGVGDSITAAWDRVLRCFVPEAERELQRAHGPSNQAHRAIIFTALRMAVLCQPFGDLHPDIFWVRIRDSNEVEIAHGRPYFDQLGYVRSDPHFRLSFN